MKKTLLIDIGSTNIKWTTFEGEREENVKNIFFPSKLNLNYPYFEVNVDEIVKNIFKIIENEKNIKRIFISVQMHGYLISDKNRKLLTNYISWQDERSILINYPYIIKPQNGTKLKANLPRISVYANYHLNKIIGEGNELFTLGSYLSYLLTNNNITHLTDGAPTGYYDIISGKPDNLFSLEPLIKLPKVLKDVELVGYYHGIEVYTPIGDQQTTILGLNPISNSYILNLGTAGQLCTISDDYKEKDFETRPYFNDKFLLTISGLISGNKIKDYCKDELVNVLYEDYHKALLKLPQRDLIYVTGGLIKYYRVELESVLEKLNINYIFVEEATALNGLKIIARKLS